MKWFFALFFGISFVFLSFFGVNCFYGYMFPIKYQDEISFVAKNFDLDEAVVFSIVNVESRFKKDAKSSKGAVGLMQIMPATAQGLAKEIGMPEFDLNDPEDNLLIGAYYIAQLCNRFEKIDTALAAYNAGPTNVKNWLNDKNLSEDGKTLKDIPFSETKNYVKKINQNLKYYKSKLKQL